MRKEDVRAEAVNPLRSAARWITPALLHCANGVGRTRTTEGQRRANEDRAARNMVVMSEMNRRMTGRVRA